MENYLENQIKNMNGSLLGIGLNSTKLKKAIEDNTNITICNLLEENEKGVNKKKFSILNKPRTINIKKIKKVFRKKRVDNIICNINTIIKYQKTFVRDSVYMNKYKIYIFGDKKSLKEIKNKYQRYTDNITLEDKGQQSVLIINTKEAKQNKIKDIAYWWLDTFNIFVDALTAILAN